MNALKKDNINSFPGFLSTNNKYFLEKLKEHRE